MPKPLPFTADEFYRMVMVSVECTEPRCRAHRGQRCRSLIRTNRNDGYTQYPHVWRRWRFTSWKQENPEAYYKIVAQIEAEREMRSFNQDTGNCVSLNMANVSET